METAIPEQISRHCRHSIRLFAGAVLMALVSITPVYAEQAVVLIAARGSGIEAISNRDIRRVFLGLKSADSNLVKKPVLNTHNRDVYEQFLKNIMHMTEGAYKRKIVKRIFRHGTEEIREIGELDELNQYLTDNVGDISFVDNDSLAKMHDIEVVKVLW